MDGNSEEDRGRDLVSKERAGARRYSAQRRDRLYLIEVESPSLNLSDGRFTRSGVLHYCRLEIHRAVTRKIDDKLRLPSTSRGWHGSVVMSAESGARRAQ